MTITRPDESKTNWSGLTGRVDEKMLESLITDYLHPTYWLCGPPAMVAAIEITLKNLAINHAQIRTEKFSGY